jgi:hypothetical protein
MAHNVDKNGTFSEPLSDNLKHYPGTLAAAALTAVVVVAGDGFEKKCFSLSRST